MNKIYFYKNIADQPAGPSNTVILQSFAIDASDKPACYRFYYSTGPGVELVLHYKELIDPIDIQNGASSLFLQTIFQE